jgi:hypothetical protein
MDILCAIVIACMLSWCAIVIVITHSWVMWACFCAGELETPASVPSPAAGAANDFQVPQCFNSQKAVNLSNNVPADL